MAQWTVTTDPFKKHTSEGTYAFALQERFSRDRRKQSRRPGFRECQTDDFTQTSPESLTNPPRIFAAFPSFSKNRRYQEHGTEHSKKYSVFVQLLPCCFTRHVLRKQELSMDSFMSFSFCTLRGSIKKSLAFCLPLVNCERGPQIFFPEYFLFGSRE